MKKLLASLRRNPGLSGMPTVAVITLLLAVFSAAGPAAAATCYLRDGSSLEYRKLWKQGQLLYVLVNRDTLLTFSPGEVDQRRTLKAAGLKRYPHAARIDKTAASSRRAPAQAKRTGIANPEDKPLVFNDDSFALSEAAASGGASPEGGGGGEALTRQLLSVYENLHDAMKSKDFEGMKRHLSVRNASSLGPREKGMIQAGMSLSPPNRIPTGSSVSSDGTSATLTMDARTDRNAPKPSALGTVSFVREGGSWKVDQESWEINVD